MHILSRAFLLCASILVLHPSFADAQSSADGTVSVTVAVVDSQFQVRTLALFQLEMWRRGDSIPVGTFKTNLQGKATQRLRPGNYTVRSTAPASSQGKLFSWSVPVLIRASRVTELELTNENAAVQASIPERPSGRDIAPEVALYQRVRNAVLKVQAGLFSGTGFVIDSLGGLVVTNEHVIDGQDDISVLPDSATRIPAQVVVADRDRDLAILRFDLRACPACGRLAIARPDSSGALVFPGERVIAIGFPLHQQSIVTSGMVSGVRDRAIISDVNINHGNSGGPLLNMTGQVVAVNTFMDGSDQGGPGISGSITITQLDSLLRRAADTVTHLIPPEPEILPVLPQATYPLSLIRSIADSADPESYSRFKGYRLGNFDLSIVTPVANFALAEAEERDLTKDRRQREARANLPESQRFSQFSLYHDWMQYVGDLPVPLVVLDVEPRIGETFGSALGRALAASGGYATGPGRYKFKGDLQALQLFRNGEPVTPVQGGRAPQAAYVDNAWVTLKDVAYRGVYEYLPDVFAPDTGGGPPSIVVQLADLKHPNDRNLFELDPEVVARIWNDFGPYYKDLSRPFVSSDPSRFHSDFQATCRDLYGYSC